MDSELAADKYHLLTSDKARLKRLITQSPTQLDQLGFKSRWKELNRSILEKADTMRGDAAK